MDITEIRGRIDALDDQLLELFLKRMELAEEVAEYKKTHGLSVTNRTREREILAKVIEKSGENEKYAYHLFSTLFELSKARQSELYGASTTVRTQVEKALEKGEQIFPQTGSIACQGTEGSNSQEACDKLLPRGNIIYVKSFEAVFDAVGSGLCKYGMLPIENSANGSVRAVYDLLQRKSFSIVRSTSLCISHELLALPGASLDDIEEIYSHEQAIGQCSQFLSKLSDKVKVTPCSNTAVAAQRVAESGNKRIAAIAAHRCADLYGLKCIANRIQDSENNYTRFICIAKEPAIYSGANRISLILSCENRSGALYGILSKLAAQGINMTKLESCPVVGKNFEFIFFLELDASIHEKGVLPMLEELERSCQSFTLLGCYTAV